MSFSERTEGSDKLLAGEFTVVRKSSEEFSPDDFTNLGLLDLVVHPGSRV
jgi:hypothetical protein